MSRFLCVDPGETTGWSIWNGDHPVAGGQTPLWEFADDVADAIEHDSGPLASGAEGDLLPGVDQEENTGPIELIIIEKFTIYPWAAKQLAWDEVRTAQLIGALTFLGRRYEIKIVKQPAAIKERAIAGGAEEFFAFPRHENRHQNDSIMHGVYYVATEINGAPKIELDR